MNKASPINVFRSKLEGFRIASSEWTGSFDAGSIPPAGLGELARAEPVHPHTDVKRYRKRAREKTIDGTIIIAREHKNIARAPTAANAAATSTIYISCAHQLLLFHLGDVRSRERAAVLNIVRKCAPRTEEISIAARRATAAGRSGRGSNQERGVYKNAITSAVFRDPFSRTKSITTSARVCVCVCVVYVCASRIREVFVYVYLKCVV